MKLVLTMPSLIVPASFRTNTLFPIINQQVMKVDYENREGKPGKTLIVFAKVNDKDSLIVTYTDSKRLFYKNLSNVSLIIKSIAILERD